MAIQHGTPGGVQVHDLAAHRREAARLGLDAEVVRLTDAAFDVDGPEDLAELSQLQAT